MGDDVNEVSRGSEFESDRMSEERVSGDESLTTGEGSPTAFHIFFHKMERACCFRVIESGDQKCEV